MQKRAVFLDRDGVINRSDGKPPNTPEELVLLPKVSEAISRLNAAGFLVFVVTNQGGVGLGYMTKKSLDRIHEKLLQEVKEGGGRIDEIKACTHRPRAGCSCRKPKPGMILDLAAKYDIDLAKSYMVGDRDSAIEAGRAAGIKTIFIGNRAEAPEEADFTDPDLFSAAEMILRE